MTDEELMREALTALQDNWFNAHPQRCAKCAQRRDIITKLKERLLNE